MTQKPKAKKPAKPHKDFPLFAHAAGVWAKKVKGKVYYFGPWDDPQAALKQWNESKDEILQTGLKPGKPSDATTVADVVNHFLTFKQDQVATGQLAERTFHRYQTGCGTLVAYFGRNRPVADLRPTDFADYRRHMSKRWGAVALSNEIQIVRSVFKYAYEVDLLERPVKFGPGFKKPTAKALRLNQSRKGPQHLTALQIRKCLDVAPVNSKAMILLAINGGLGNTDIAELTMAAIDLPTGWMNYPRPKTGTARKIPLWPETIAAIKEVLQHRVAPIDPDDKALVFIGQRGQNYRGNHKGYRVHQETKRVFKKAGIPERSFYDLRRTFETEAEASRDLAAVQAIMGHAPPANDMSARYRQHVHDERLQAVTDHVHAWLFENDNN
ncbi:MAG: tyrosine-type recombinase/integrase [Planctomycetales bacterium]|nr:tyrosine-type recombinase/integrase [Planctomycetales bacterium]